MLRSLTFIDLFCGCGGFSLGLERAGFKGLAGIDFNPEAVKVFRENFPKVPQVLEKDLTSFHPSKLEALIGTKQVDLIVGGPPCQGFSTARQVDGANHGERLKEDPRRHLYREFLRYVAHFQPKVFVMENVLGIRSASGGRYFTKVQAEARKLGYRVHPQTEDCVDLGVPQKRRRQLFIGTRLDIVECFRPKLEPPARAVPNASLWEAISDLPPLKAGEGKESREYDIERRINKVTPRSAAFQKRVLEIDKTEQLTAHRARPHNDRDLRDFALLREGENSAEAMRRGVEFEFPYDKSCFKDRYTRQHRNRPCSTIVAHLAKDGLMFIHPTQNRTLTPREAARVQTFPDWFQFPVARTHQFRVIGNAVPPLVGEAVGIAVKDYLTRMYAENIKSPFSIYPLPQSHEEAARWIDELITLNRRELRRVSDTDLKRTWHAVFFLFIGLHPDSALDHGSNVVDADDIDPEVHRLSPSLQTPCFERSGWPIRLKLVAEEAWRRYDAGLLSDDEFYCAAAQMAGACYRDPSLKLMVEAESRLVG